jgi:hypothetical protein
MTRKYWLLLSAIIGFATITITIVFKWGYSAGIRESLRISARSDVLQNLNIARHLHENAQRDALSGVDARINISVMEISQLSSRAWPEGGAGRLQGSCGSRKVPPKISGHVR